MVRLYYVGIGIRIDSGSSFVSLVDKSSLAYGRCASRIAGRLDSVSLVVFSYRRDKKRRYIFCGYKSDNF